MISHRLVIFVGLLVACGEGAGRLPDEDPLGCEGWRQWGNSAAHAGVSCARGQPLLEKLAEIEFDPFVDQDLVGGVLRVHYQVPLIDGDSLYMMQKTGTYSACDDGSAVPCTQVWSERRYAIASDGALTQVWSFDSDWKPAPVFLEPMFQPALVGERIAIPGAGGGLWLLDAASGAVMKHVQPFGPFINVDTYVSGGLAAADDGTIYYNVIKLSGVAPYDEPTRSWLVAVAADGSARVADYATLVPGAPKADELCAGSYDFAGALRPWPPLQTDGAPELPPRRACGPQRPGFNVTPAIGADGTIFVATVAHFNARYSYVVAVDRGLVPRWATSLRDRVQDGCGISVPSDGTDAENFDHCRVGTPEGVERLTGLPVAGQVNDSATSSPVALPDGGVLYGAFTSDNRRGYLFKLDRAGEVVGQYDFGWDSTPAVIGSAEDYRIVIKDNHYAEEGPHYITQLDASMNVVWRFANTNTQSCVRQPDGSVACVEDHPKGFSWCVNALAVDGDGTVYGNAEDGRAYAINADGTLRESMFLDAALRAAYTPIALDGAGRVFALNRGRLSVLGRR